MNLKNNTYTRSLTGSVCVCYDSVMKYFLWPLIFMAWVVPAYAFEVYTSTPTSPYEIIPFTEAIDVKQIYVGQLNNFPVMYETTLESTTTLSIQVSQRYQNVEQPLGLALMVVRVDENDGGVTEVLRLRPSASDWMKRKDKIYGMTFWDSELLTRELGVGTYRIEVSTPDNLGSYALAIGEFDDWLGFFETLKRVRIVQANFGYSIFGMLRSTYVYYPVGIILLLFVFYRTWKARKYISHVA